jgi:formylglycine-generating enzyme required for sulfatase activity
MKHTASALIIAACVLFGACEAMLGNKEADPSALVFAFTPVPLAEGGASAGIKAGGFETDGTVTLEAGAGDNGKFEISGNELVLKEDLSGGPYEVLFRVAGPEGVDFTWAGIIFVAFAGGPTDIEFTPAYRLMKDTAAARGLAPIGAFEPEGGTAPYLYSVVEYAGDDGLGNNNASFRGGVGGIYAKSNIDPAIYKIYVRCTDRNGKHYQKGIEVEIQEYAPPDFAAEEDFVHFEGGLVGGLYGYQSDVFIDGRILEIPPFRLAKYEVSRQLWWEVYQWAISDERGENKYTFTPQNMNNNPLPSAAPAKADEAKPQLNITWDNTALWLNAFSEMRGLDPVYRSGEDEELVARSGSTITAPSWRTRNGYRLPWNGEWEYAARGGVPSTDEASVWMYKYAGTNSEQEFRSKYGWTYYSTLPDGTINTSLFNNDILQPVGLMLPNTAGLYDMSGNGFEWCGDRYPQYKALQITADDKIPVEGLSGDYCVIRQGIYLNNPSPHHDMNTNLTHDTVPTSNVGFRIARSMTAWD